MQRPLCFNLIFHVILGIILITLSVLIPSVMGKGTVLHRERDPTFAAKVAVAGVKLPICRLPSVVLYKLLYYGAEAAAR